MYGKYWCSNGFASQVRVLCLSWTVRPVLAGAGLFGCPGGEVFGPVASRVADPPDSGVDVHAEDVGQDRGGQVGGQRGEGSVAGGADVDAMTAKSGGQGVIGDRLAWAPGRETASEARRGWVEV